MSILSDFLGLILNFCYDIVHVYGWAIVLFTFFSKLVMAPLSVWIQKNEIKLVELQPQLNEVKINYYGLRDRIDEEVTAIYKREKYSPFANIIPLTIQIVLLLGLVAVVRNPLAYLKNVELPFDSVFFGIDLSRIPIEARSYNLLIPIIAGCSAFLLSICQNKSNVLQAEQSKLAQYSTMILSIAISLFLGFYVPAGVGLYWIFSNIFAVIQLYVLNALYDPAKYVDYEALEKTRKELGELEAIGRSKKGIFGTNAYTSKEKADYKRFFKVVNKHIVFYSESNGFYKYFAGIIEYLLENSKLTIHYITSDPEDSIFKKAQNNTRIRAYYIGEGRLISLMMKMDADIVVMTMPDIQNFHIKRSYVRKDIEYIYIPHDMNSHNLLMRTGSTDHYDTIFCTGPHQWEECEKTDILNFGEPKRKLIKWGYTLLDDMKRDYAGSVHDKHERKIILIAPSWQRDNIFTLCIEDILNSLKGKGFRIIVRPHPQQVKHEPERLEAIADMYKGDGDIEFEMDFSSTGTVFEADMMITDWSGVALEYAYTTYHPVIFIDTPMKVMNPDYQKIDTVPINIWIRQEIGKSLKVEKAGNIYETVNYLFEHDEDYTARIKDISEKYTYNIGCSAKVGGEYIKESLKEKIRIKGIELKAV